MACGMDTLRRHNHSFCVGLVWCCSVLGEGPGKAISDTKAVLHHVACHDDRLMTLNQQAAQSLQLPSACCTSHQPADASTAVLRRAVTAFHNLARPCITTLATKAA